MNDLVDPRLAAWQNFHVVVGSSGAALIGVQFVVITLIAHTIAAGAVGPSGDPLRIAQASLLVGGASTGWPALL